MATYKIKIISEKLFSKRGKVRRDKRTAYNLAQQRKANQQKQNNINPQKPIVTPNNGTNNATILQKPNNEQTQSVITSSPSTQNSSNLGNTATNATQNQQTQSSPIINQQNQIDPNKVVGQQSTGQQGTTGNVNRGGQSTLKKAKPILKGAGIALGAGLLATGAAALYGAKKVGQAVSEGAENMGDRLEENRRWRREEKMAKRLIKAGYNPYQDGQRIGGYAFTTPRYYR